MFVEVVVDSEVVEVADVDVDVEVFRGSSC